MQLTFDIFAPPTTPAIRIAFRSGMSTSKDFWAAAAAGADIGVVAGEMSFGMTLIGLPRFLKDGGRLFIDSGAFSELKHGISPDFDKVLAVYERVQNAADSYGFSLDRLYVVAPDKVGDQLETLNRLTRYRERVRALLDAGCRVIVPIQRGALPAAAMLDRVADILGTRAFVAGIPSNKEALSLDECASLTHDRFHILGRVQMNPDQAARLAALGQRNPEADITADANWLRGRLGEVIDRTDAERTARAGQRHLITPRSVAITTAIKDDTTWGQTAPQEQ